MKKLSWIRCLVILVGVCAASNVLAISVSPSSVNYNGSYTINWNKPIATGGPYGPGGSELQERVQGSGSPWTTITLPNGTTQLQIHASTRSNNTSYEYRIESNDCIYIDEGVGEGFWECFPVTGEGPASVFIAPPPPTVSASFNTSAISEGGSATFSWGSTNATSCSASGISGVSGLSGSVSYNAPTVMSSNQNVTATVTCVGLGGSGNDSASLLVNYINDRPTITSIPYRTINEDQNTGWISFAVSDEESSSSSLTLSATSTDTTVVPTSGITLSGSGANRSVRVEPAGDKHGASTIIVSVSDGVNSSSRSFVVTVIPINDAPTIGGVGDRTINEDSSTGAIGFTVVDLDSSASALTLSATSTNQTLVPNGNIQFGGSGSSRNVTVSPADNQTGSTTISVTVSDGFLTASTNFVVTVDPQNDAPTISGISNQTINEDRNTGAIGFTVNDVDSSNGLLTLSASSNKTTLIPNGNITFGGNGINRTITVKPADNQFGNATITVTVSDGSLTSDRSFVVTVNSVNDMPTINPNPIGSQSIDVNTNTGPVPFTIGDIETPAGSLRLEKTSSNTTLVPTSNITFGGSGANRTLSVTPAPNQVGSSVITVVVFDLEGSGRGSSFSLVVNSVNSAPTLSTIADQTINEDGNTGAIGFTVNDVDSSNGSLTLSGNSSKTTLIPNGNISFGGSGSNRTITVVPANNQFGSATITATVSDGSLTFDRSFVVVVNSVNDLPTINPMPIGSRTIEIDTSTGSVPFTIGDVETSASSLTLTKTSSNPTLVPTSNIAFGGNGANRNLVVTPASGQSGSAVITVLVSDAEGANSTSTLNLEVYSSNTAPTLSAISDQTIYENGSTGAKSFTIGDAESSPSSLSLSRSSSNTSLVPTSNIVFGGSGANRTVTVTPAANQFGTATITVTVSDGTLTANQNFVLTVLQGQSGPSKFNLKSQNGADFTLNLDQGGPDATAISARLIKLSPTAQSIPFDPRLSEITFTNQAAGHYVFEVDYCYNEQPEPGPYCDSEVQPSLPRVAFDITTDVSHIEPAPTIVPSGQTETMPFTYSVDQSGDLNIQAPVSVPSGINGLAPNISLSYSANKSYLSWFPDREDPTTPVTGIDRNWRLNGFAHIRTCDIKFAKYCLGKKRLIPEDTGSQSTPGKKFRLEDNPNVRFESFREAATGNIYFQMKIGSRTLTFGNTAEGRITRSANFVTNDYWFVQQMQDSYSNALHVSYVHANDNSEIYPHIVDYGGYQVEFGYALNQGSNEQYAGEISLHTIRNIVNGVRVSEFHITYNTVNSADTGTYSLLNSVQSCGYDSNGQNPACRQPLIFGNLFEQVPPSGGPSDGIFTAIDQVTDGFSSEGFGNITNFIWENESVSPSQFPGLTEYPVDGLKKGELNSQFTDPGTCEQFSMCGGNWQVRAIENSNGVGGVNYSEYAYATVASLNELVRVKLPDGTYTYTKYYAKKQFTAPPFNEHNPLLTGKPIEQHHYKDKFTYTASDELISKKEYQWNGLRTLTGVPLPEQSSSLFTDYFSFKQMYLSTSKTFSYENGIDGAVSVEKNTLIKNENSGLIDQSINEKSVGFGLNTDDTLGIVEKTLKTTSSFEHDTANWLVGFKNRSYMEHLNVQGEANKALEAIFVKENTFSLKVGRSTKLNGTALAVTTDYSYDSFGNLTTTTISGLDFPSRTSTNGNFLDKRYPQSTTQDLSLEGPVLNATTQLEYDRRFGSVSNTIDANNLASSAVRDNLGRVVQNILPTGALVNTYYDLCNGSCGSVAGEPIVYKVFTETLHQTTSLAKGAPDSKVGYDSFGRAIRQQTESFGGNWITVDSVYDDLSHIIRRSLPYISGTPKYVEFEFDVRDRTRLSTNPDGSSTNWDYQQNGVERTVTATETILRNGNSKTQIKVATYNGIGQLISSTDAVGTSEQITTEYDYDSLGNRDWVRVNNSNNNISPIMQTQFNSAGFPQEITDPSTGTTVFDYDALGQIKSQIDARGIQTNFDYDLIGRITQRTDGFGSANAVVNNYAFDTRKVGLLSTRSNPGFVENYFYNGLAQTESITSDINVDGINESFSTDLTYDDYGRGLTQSYPTGLTTRNNYNDSGYASGISDDANGNSLSTVNAVDHFGNVTSSTLGNGLNTTRRFAPNTGFLTRIETGSDASVQDLRYRWWSNGTLQRRVLRGATNARETFFYDGLNRLTDANSKRGRQKRKLDYSYDLLGNLTSKRDNRGSDAREYKYLNSDPYRLSSVELDGVVHTYGYDEVGNIILDNVSGTSDDRTITYNAFGKPVDITKGSSARQQFQYGPDGSRFYKKTQNSGDQDKTLYLFGGSVEIVYPTQGAVTEIRKAYLGDVVHIWDKTIATQSDRFEYLHTDHLGSVDVITDENGNVITRNNFDPFGSRRNEAWLGLGAVPSIDFNNAHTPRGFSGHEHIDDVGLIHMNGRVYDPVLGRFMSADPVISAPSFSQDYNRYSYAWNNPLNVTDPSGYTENTEGLSDNDHSEGDTGNLNLSGGDELVITGYTRDKNGKKINVVIVIDSSGDITSTGVAVTKDTLLNFSNMGASGGSDGFNASLLHPVSGDDMFMSPGGKEQIDLAFSFAKLTVPDVNFGNSYKVKELGLDKNNRTILGRVLIPGGVSKMTIDNMFVGQLNMKEMVLLLDTIIHEGLHRTYSLTENMRMGFDHPEIFQEAHGYTDMLRDAFEGHIRSVYQ